MKLIDKDALVVEIDRQKIGYNVDCKHSVEYDTTRKILNIIDTLEVKEVDLKKEIENELDTRWRGEYLSTSKFRESAKHFFELGLKAQKGKKHE